MPWLQKTYSFTGSDLQDFGRETDGTVDTELLVFSAVDQVSRNYSYMLVRILKHRIEQCKHFSRFLTLLLVRVMRILCILAPGTGAPVASYSFSPLAT